MVGGGEEEGAENKDWANESSGHFGMFPSLKSSVQSNCDTITGIAKLLGMEVSEEVVRGVFTVPPPLVPSPAVPGEA